MQYSAVLSRSRGQPESFNRSSISLGSIVAIPIKEKKQTKSQRKAAAAKAREKPVQIIQWVEDSLGEHVWEHCFEYLDISSVIVCRLVCRHFRRLAQLPIPWMVHYSHEWMKDDDLPLEYRQFTWQQLWHMHTHRQKLDIKLSTRAEVSRNHESGLLNIINNSMLRSLANGAVESVRSLQPLPTITCAEVFGRHITYFEVTCNSYISLGIVHLPDLSKCMYGFGSDAHVGWQPHSFGYHCYGTTTDSIVYHTGKDLGHMAIGQQYTIDFTLESHVLGCGFDLDTRRVFFTRNGVHQGSIPYVVPPGNFAAAVSIDDMDATVQLNFGQSPFEYSIERHVILF